MDLSKISYAKKRVIADLDLNTLKRSYQILCELLDEKYFSEKKVTWFEFELARKIKRFTRMQVYQSIWIGKRNIDIFLPSIAGHPSKANRVDRLKGLAIEVDGDIHNGYSKMMRDNSKYDFLYSLNIGVYTVENNDINHKNVNHLIHSLTKLPRVDTRAKARTWRKIYLSTLMSHKELIEKSNLEACKSLISYF